MGDVEVVTLHIEACQKQGSNLSESAIKAKLNKYLDEQKELVLHTAIRDSVLPTDLNYVRFCSSPDHRRRLNMSESIARLFHIYQTWDDGPQTDSLTDENGDVPASLNWCLPNTAFEGLWESLVLENDSKDRLMSYVQTALLYADKKVNPQLIRWNGVVLLHGPPGTGKTTLCKALAQKLSIRLNTKYKSSQLIEINSHSLFSKWFSESAKLVLKLFSSIRQWLQSDDHFVCILIDEVESLTHVRKSNGTEPSDSIRVVNAVLTQIDQLQRYPNFVILATSNVTDTIDMAFADRADLKLFVPYPSEWAMYEIIKTCIEELITCELVKGNKNDFFEGHIFRKMYSPGIYDENQIISEIRTNSELLFEVCSINRGHSGRTIRKIPFLTSAKFIDKEPPTITQFLKEMKEVTWKHMDENYRFNQANRKDEPNFSI